MPDAILQNQAAIVTGANSGIGYACAEALAQHGAAVAINYHRHAESAMALAAKIVAAGGRSIAVDADVSSESDVARLFATTREAFGAIDIVISNAGLQKDAALTEMTLDDWNATLSIDLTGAFLCSREAARTFVRQGVRSGVSRAAGKLIFISSVHQRIPWTGHANYAAAKGGVDLLMQTAAQELAGQRIRVNAVAPGAIKTDINKAVWGDPLKAEKLLELIPYGRIGDVADVTNAAVWLASDASDYVTGTTLFVDGGMTLYASFISNG